MTINENQVIFGAAKELITPCIRTTLMGFGTVFGVPFKDIHDDLYARCMILRDSAGETVIFLGMDLLFHDDDLPNALREYAFKTYSVPAENLHVSYSHTHYGPAAKGYDFTWYKQEYEAFLFDRLCRCIDRAFLTLRPGTMKFTRITGEWNASRRRMENGVMLHHAPSIDGECDKNLYLLRLDDESGKMRALAMSFACHASNLNDYFAVSSEYPGRLCQRVETEFYGTTALFYQGFGADAKLKLGMKSLKSFTPLTYDEIDEVTLSMVHRIKAKMLSDDWQTLSVKLASRTFKLELPLDINPSEYYQDYKNRYAADPNAHYEKLPGNPDDMWGNSKQLIWACADHVLDNYDNLPEALALNCGAIRINPDFYIFSMGGEPGVNIQTVLRESMPDKQILCFGYNDAIAYIPSDKMVKEGGYEADESVYEYRLKGKIAAGVDKIFCDGFKSAIESMK